MAQTMCPGQDTAFWRPGDVYEVPCSNCGYEVEFFKDDATRRCTRCGQLIRNPKLNLGCAQWCEHAKECLGYDPKEVLAEAEGGDSALVDRLIEAMKQRIGDEQDKVSRSLELLEAAKRLMAAEGGDPRVILSAAVLSELPPDQAEQVMKELELDEATRLEVKALLAGDSQSAEAGLMADARLLLQAKDGPAPPPEAFKTQAGRQLAQAG